MPPSKKHEHCTHDHQIAKTIHFHPEERDEAKRLGLGLPELALISFCVECWGVNRKTKVGVRPVMPKEGKVLK